MQNQSDSFEVRHIGVSESDVPSMLQEIGFSDLDQLVKAIVPEDILLNRPLNLANPLSETQMLQVLRKISLDNQPIRSLIGQGYYDTITPPVILRNILENPAWYTAYTPYQPEISQGRLEMLLNFQTMICELTAMDIANASMLDEATAAAEAMLLARRQSKSKSMVFLVDNCVHPQTINVLKTRAKYQNITIKLVDCFNSELTGEDCFGLLVQAPCTRGFYADWQNKFKNLDKSQVVFCVATDLLACTLFVPPGEWGADIVVGSAQNFGVPMGFGGPHAGFLATKDAFKRAVPGRLVGVSKDSRGKKAYRLALQTREQHIRREKATSNVCTAQALLAIMAAAYALYHGKDGLTAIANKIYQFTSRVQKSLAKYQINSQYSDFFNTLSFKLNKEAVTQIMERALANGYNLRLIDDETFAFSFDEKTTEQEALAIVRVITGNQDAELLNDFTPIADDLARKTDCLKHPIFEKYHSETEMMRYLRRLADYDLALDRTMIPLGSCTMKLNSAAEMQAITWPEFANVHPFAPADQTIGYQKILSELAQNLCEITGYDAFSFQPNSGAQGEYAGLLAIRAYQEAQGEKHRDICLIPASAHGTNPASAALAGMKVVVVACDDKGNIDLADLSAKIDAHKNNLSAMMVTYPSTHGVFEKAIVAICKMVHEAGGQVYLDGANLNAQVGLAAPGLYGADVSHLNLHKTFAIPHGGGGPGLGPIGVKSHLAPFLPNDDLAVSAAPFGSALIAIISWAYIKLLGNSGLVKSSKIALLNANYIAARLKGAYDVLYSDENGRVAHECIIDIRPFKEKAGISVDDIAKRLMDYGFHAPTMSFPVAGTLMIEPTESESKAELDRFCDALLAIRAEIAQIEQGELPKDDNPLVNAPHTLADLVDDWNRAYSRKTAIFPVEGNPAKYFTPVNRIDNVYGDRFVFCSCPPVDDYS